MSSRWVGSAGHWFGGVDTRRLSGVLVALSALLVALSALSGSRELALLSGFTALACILLLLPGAGRGERLFVLIGLGLAILLLVTRQNAFALLAGPVINAGFIISFFAAVASLRNAASTSRGLERCGWFFASQPEGRRYAMLTAGGAVYSLMLSYGALSVLGMLAERAAEREPDPGQRLLRKRRMLLAIQRGLVSMLTWSPIAFPMALSTAIIPGADWSQSLPVCLPSAAMLIALGWVLDRFGNWPMPEPGEALPRPDAETASSVFADEIAARPPWHELRTLLVLLVSLLGLILIVHHGLGVRAVAAVVVVVPPFCLIWIALQQGLGRHGWSHAFRRAGNYIVEEIPTYRAELIILGMAGVIGALGALIAGPLLAQFGWAETFISAPALLVGILWLMPITGQLGMNPIITLSLIGPLLPEATAMGTSPEVIVLALASGWALSGASSPFTATTMLVGRLGGSTARKVGLSWNLAFTLIGGVLLSLWLLLLMAFYG